MLAQVRPCGGMTFGGGAPSYPMRASEAEQVLTGKPLTEDLIVEDSRHWGCRGPPSPARCLAAAGIVAQST